MSIVLQSSMRLNCLYGSLGFLCLVGLSCLSFSTLAATLFIDLNNAPAEIAAVRASRPAKEPLISVPSVRLLSPEHRAKVFAIQQTYDRIHNRGLDCASQGNCQEVWSELRRLELERLRLIERIDPKNLALDIAQELTGKTFTIDRVVISGHHAEGYFLGEVTALDVEAIKYLHDAVPQAFQHVRAVYLLGCETGTVENIRKHFSQLFPTAQLIVGAEDNAPTRNEARNLTFIRAVMALERSFMAANDQKGAGALYKKLLVHPWPVSLFWQRRYYYSREYPSGIALD